MHNNKKIVFLILSFFLIISLSGCAEIFSDGNKVTYKELKTKISFDISYGVRINCTGSGRYDIRYSCDTPEVLIGEIKNMEVLNVLYKDLYDQASFNDLKHWNISNNGECDFFNLGINASVIVESFNVENLNGKDCLTTEEISAGYPDLIKSYCKKQANDTVVFINPDDPDISSIAKDIYDSQDTDNSFIIARELFSWLKKNTDYEPHYQNNNVQPASLTFDIKTGDCDDLTYLYLSLCRSLDIPARFVRGFLVTDNSAIAHAWAEVFVGLPDNDGWIPVECAGGSNEYEVETEIHQNFAFESSNHLRLFLDDGSNESINISHTGVIYSSDNNVLFNSAEFFANISNYNILEEKKLSISKDNIRTFK